MEFKIAQCADDTCLYLTDESSLKNALYVFEVFEKCSGLKVKREKSECIWIAASSNFRHKPLGMKWNKGASYLGLYICNNVKDMNEINFNKQINKIENILDLWALRKLTLKGKIQVINTLIISQVLYPATVIHIPKQYMTSTNKHNKLAKNFHLGPQSILP
jgi:ribonucleotide reductase alpha subunit